MEIPKGMTEKQVLDAIETVANGLATRFKFGYHDGDDLKQEARLESVKALPRYDPQKSDLTTFLWTHVRNRLSNLKRNKFERHDKPCFSCPLKAYDPDQLRSRSGCTEYEDKSDCRPYLNWETRNSAKRNIMCPVGIQSVRDEHEPRMKRDSDIVEDIYSSEIIRVLDDKIPVSLRSSWVKLQNDIRMNKPEREKLLAAIRQILVEENYAA